MQPSKLIPTVTLLLSVSNTAACLAALPSATPASAPVAAPAPTTFVVGLDGNATGTFTAGPAPATVHVSALGLSGGENDWLDERYAWNFGDGAGTQTVIDPRTNQPVNLNTALTGPVAAYLYELPGTYTVRLTRTLASGATATYTATVVVPLPARTTIYVAPDGNDANPGTSIARPLATVGTANKKLADHTALLLRRGGTYPVTESISLQHADLLVDCYGDGGQPLPVLSMTNPAKLQTNNALLFTTWLGKTSDVTLRHFRVDAPWAAATLPGGYAYQQPVSCFGTLRGRNVTIADVELAHCYEGPNGSDALTGNLNLRVRQVEPLGVVGRTLWLQGNDVVTLGCVALNSITESPLRTDLTGINRGLIAFNDIAQQADPAHGRTVLKAAVTLRTLADVTVVGNRVSNAEFSFDPHAVANLDQRVVVEGNATDNAMLHVKANVRHAVFRDNTFSMGDGPCVGVTPAGDGPGWWIEDVRVEHNAGRGWTRDSRMLSIDTHPDDTLKAFTADPALNVYQRIVAPN